MQLRLALIFVYCGVLATRSGAQPTIDPLNAVAKLVSPVAVYRSVCLGPQCGLASPSDGRRRLLDTSICDAAPATISCIVDDYFQGCAPNGLVFGGSLSLGSSAQVLSEVPVWLGQQLSTSNLILPAGGRNSLTGQLASSALAILFDTCSFQNAKAVFEEGNNPSQPAIADLVFADGNDLTTPCAGYTLSCIAGMANNFLGQGVASLQDIGTEPYDVAVTLNSCLMAFNEGLSDGTTPSTVVCTKDIRYTSVSVPVCSQFQQFAACPVKPYVTA